MFMECYVCKKKKSSNYYSNKIRIMEMEVDNLLRLIPRDFKADYRKQNRILMYFRNHPSTTTRGFCGKHCVYVDKSLDRRMKDIHNNISKILCYYEFNKELKLIPLKNICRGKYGYIYQVIERVERNALL